MDLTIVGRLKSLRDISFKSGSVISLGKIATELTEARIRIKREEVSGVVAAINSALDLTGRGLLAPHSELVTDAIRKLLKGRRANIVCDPFAGLGALLSVAADTTGAATLLAFSPNPDEAELGQYLVSDAEWRIGNPLELLEAVDQPIDVIVSVFPFGYIDPDRPRTRVSTADERTLLAAARKLESDGVMYAVVKEGFFPMAESAFNAFREAGIGIHAAFSLPKGTFAPTAIRTQLLVVSRKSATTMFVAELTAVGDDNDVISNFAEGREGSAPEAGRYVAPATYTSIAELRFRERLRAIQRDFDGVATTLGELAQATVLGRGGPGFSFSEAANAVYVPLLGNSDVRTSIAELSLKQQNYAQVTIDGAKSRCEFVAQFLNSEMGREIREAFKTGVISRLNSRSLAAMTILLPPPEDQSEILALEARVEGAANIIHGVQNDLNEVRRSVWSKGQRTEALDRLTRIEARLSGELAAEVAGTLTDWFERLPFPLASILRAWQATPPLDSKTRCEHLLHFFEASAEFLSVIFLSAFSSNDELYGAHKEKFSSALAKNQKSLERADFGTWKVIIDFFAKQTRKLLSSEVSQERSVCKEMFGDETLRLPAAIARVEVAEVLGSANKLRNDRSHGGVLGPEDARLLNERLLGEVQRFREALGDAFDEVQIVRALQCRPRKGMFDTDLALLSGSNSEFLKETRLMTTCLDVDRLYLTNTGGVRGLELIPFIVVSASPQSQRNACYFFNRLDQDAARFVSYHFIDEPEVSGDFNTAETIRRLTVQPEPGR